MKIFKEIIDSIWNLLLMLFAFLPALILFCSLNNIARGISFIGILIQEFGDFVAAKCTRLVKYIVDYGNKLFLE